MISLVENAFNSFLLGLFIKGEVTRALSTKANPLLKTIRVKLNIQPCYPCFKWKKNKNKAETQHKAVGKDGHKFSKWTKTCNKI